MSVLSSDLIKEFVKNTHDESKDKTPSRFQGTAAVQSDGIYVRLDGSTILMPVSMVTDAQNGDRVLVEIVDHTARIVQNLDKSNSEFVADRIEHDETGVFKELRVGKEYVESLVAKDITADTIIADRAKIGELEADNVTINEKLTAAEASIGNLEAENVTISGEIAANKASIKDLETNKLSAEDADIRYLNVDFSKIDKAWLQEFYAQSGIIKDLVIGDSTVTGHLVGVTISGDLIEGNTVKADKLVIKGEDGLYYKLNIEGGSTVTEQLTKEMLQNGLDGNNIIANTITAEKISVKDLIAFDATIGGFNIGSNSIYSGVKDSINNTTRGIYLDTEGQMYFGDDTNYIRYYKAKDGTYKLAINSKSITFGSGITIEEAFEELRDEITTLLRIESSRGTVFKNDQVSTVLSAVIYHGTQRITDYATMKSVFGSGAYLQWKWQRLDEESYGIISSTDTRFSDNGFKFTLSPEDVDTKVTFMCELIV